MEIKIKTRHMVGILLGVFILALNFLFLMKTRWFKPIIAIGLIFATMQFWMDILNENKRQKDIETKFLEFVRGLVETVKSGIPIPKAIMHISNTDFGALTPYVKKLANQIEWGFPLHDALTTFAIDTNNPVIKRSVSIVIEAERSGGNVDEVLQAVTDSVVIIKKIREERRSETYSQLVQGYLVFFVFIAIMLTLQIYLIPQLTDIGSVLTSGLGGGGFEGLLKGSTGGGTKSSLNLDFIFVWLILIQGLFSGLLMGKFAEGQLKMGLKHSLIVMILGYLIITTVRGI